MRYGYKNHSRPFPIAKPFMPISLGVSIACFGIVWLLRRMTGYREVSVVFLFLLANAVSLATTMIPETFFVFTRFVWPMSPGFDWYNAQILLAVTAIGIPLMFMKTTAAEQHGNESPYGTMIADEDVFYAFLILFIVGGISILFLSLSTISSLGSSLSEILVVSGAHALADNGDASAGASGFLSIPFYASAMLLGPMSQAKKLSLPAILVLCVLFAFVALIKDLSLAKRGFTLNTTLLAGFSLLLWRRDIGRSLAIGVIGGGVFLIGSFLAIVILRFAGDSSLAVQVAVDNVAGKFYGQWVASSYIFDAALGASPIPGLLTVPDILPLQQYQSNYYDYLYYMPVTAAGPWNTSTGLGRVLQDFGLFAGTLVFLGNYSAWVVLEFFYARGGKLATRLFYNAVLPMVCMNIIAIQLFADVRFLLATGLALSAIFAIAVARMGIPILARSTGG